MSSTDRAPSPSFGPIESVPYSEYKNVCDELTEKSKQLTSYKDAYNRRGREIMGYENEMRAAYDIIAGLCRTGRPTPDSDGIDSWLQRNVWVDQSRDEE